MEAAGTPLGARRQHWMERRERNDDGGLGENERTRREAEGSGGEGNRTKKINE